MTWTVQRKQLSLFLTVSLLTLVSSAPIPFNYKFRIRLNVDGFDEQHASVICMKFNAERSTKKCITAHGSDTHQTLAPGGEIKGEVQFLRDSLEEIDNLEFEWISEEKNAGGILLDGLFFIDNQEYHVRHGRKYHVYCYHKGIKSGHPVTLKRCFTSTLQPPEEG